MVNSKTKGKQGELEIANILREAGYPDARRGQQYCGLEGAADVVGVPGLHIEVKRRERLNIHEALTKCREEALCEDMPIVIHRRNGEQWIASVSLADFLELWKMKTKDENLIDAEEYKMNIGEMMYHEHFAKYTEADLLAELERRKA